MKHIKIYSMDLEKVISYITSIFWYVCVLGLSSCYAQKNTSQKLNLLIIWTDEQAVNTMKVYGNEKIQTPNLNKLAKEGIVFKNTYVSQPVCTPSRSTVMTGLWPTQIL